jgi:hypothetical protein
MAHKLISDEMVQKAWTVLMNWGAGVHKAPLRAALEAVVDEIRNQVIAECIDIAQCYEPRCDICPSGVTNAIRSLKSQGQ